MKYLLLTIFLFLIISCNDKIDQFSLDEISVPTRESGQANLFVDENNQAYLSWLESINDTTFALQYSRLNNSQWTAPIEIARSSNWFINWADFPSLAVTADGTLFAHWLEMSAEGTYDYDVHISISNDGGATWSPSIIPHDDGISAEHGFVSLQPIDEDEILATWLDGRNTKSSENISNDNHGHYGAMSLRSASIRADGKVWSEIELDHKVCDCCQTDMAMTSDGPVIVYRDRTDEEIRDISLIRKIGVEWTQPRDLSSDQWLMKACPVNGPSIDAIDQSVAVAWYTGAKDDPAVYVKFSDDSGESFRDAIKINEYPTLGRVDVEMISADEAVLTWLENKDGGTFIMIKKLSVDGTSSPSYPLITTSDKRQSGFPIIEKLNRQLLITWVDISGQESKVRTAKIDF